MFGSPSNLSSNLLNYSSPSSGGTFSLNFSTPTYSPMGSQVNQTMYGNQGYGGLNRSPKNFGSYSSRQRGVPGYMYGSGNQSMGRGKSFLDKWLPKKDDVLDALESYGDLPDPQQPVSGPRSLPSGAATARARGYRPTIYKPRSLLGMDDLLKLIAQNQERYAARTVRRFGLQPLV